MNGTDAVILNSHGVGQYAFCDHLPQWGETLSVKDWRIAQDGGKGTNVSVALARLGVRCAFVGKVGNDLWGDLGEQWMTAAGVDCTFLYRTDEVATGTALILIGPDGQNAIIDGDGSSVALTPNEVVSALDTLRDASFFITGFEMPASLSLAGARYAKHLGMKTVLNPSPVPDSILEDLHFIDYLFVNELEAHRLAQIGSDRAVDCKALCKLLKDRLGARSVIMTRGSDGSCAYAESGEFSVVRPFPVKSAVNTAGAGDGFMAATVAGLIEGKSLGEALPWASCYAALSVTIDGTIPAYRTKAETERFILDQNHTAPLALGGFSTPRNQSDNTVSSEEGKHTNAVD